MSGGEGSWAPSLRPEFVPVSGSASRYGGVLRLFLLYRIHKKTFHEMRMFVRNTKNVIDMFKNVPMLKLKLMEIMTFSTEISSFGHIMFLFFLKKFLYLRIVTTTGEKETVTILHNIRMNKT